MSAGKADAGKSLVSDDASRELLAAIGQFTGGMSPQALGGAWWNVLSHLALAPGRQAEIARTAIQKAITLAQFTGSALQQARRGTAVAPQAEGSPYANRFADPAWAKFPFNVLAQSFIDASEVARDGRARRARHRLRRPRMSLISRCAKDSSCSRPDNYLPTNPQLLEQTRRGTRQEPRCAA